MSNGPIITVGDRYIYEDLISQSDRLLVKYDCLTKEEIGTSVLGKPIFALMLGTGKRIVHLNASVHANEWITTPLLLKFIENLACAYNVTSDMQSPLKEITICAVPMVNPDGVDLSQLGIPLDYPLREDLLSWNHGKCNFSHWKGNIRGVDLNDQFPAYWEEEVQRRGITSPASQDYGGTMPLSEPEAACLAQLTRERDFERVLSLHTQGRELYWNYRDMEPELAEQFAHSMAKAGAYQAVKLSGSDAGYKDWFIQEFRRPGFTLEAGYGVNPLPPSQFQNIYEEIEPILWRFIQGFHE